MANDRMQEEIDDFVNGDINEQIESEVNNRFRKMMSGKSYTIEDEIAKKQELRRQVRNEILETMQFRRRYQEERHLDDLQDQERRYDQENSQYISDHMNDRWWNEKQAMRAEERIYTDDINGINPNAVVTQYATIADFFNISDTITMQKALENGQAGNIDIEVFRGLIQDEEGKRALEVLRKNNNGSLSLEQLTSGIADIMKNNATSRIETAKGFMEVAEKDLEARATGTERKIDILNKAGATSEVRDQAYINSINNSYEQGLKSARESEGIIKHNISLAEIENATKNVPISSINGNIRAIENKIQDRDVSKDEDKEME